jgi:predicted alpha/beta hydrolase family esterase
MNAKYNEWKIFFEKWIEKIEIVGNIIFIGNSLGGCFLLRYFSEDNLKIDTNTIHSIHLVASCLSAGDFNEGKNYHFLKKLKENIFIWHAEDDIVVPISDAKKLSKILPD